MRQDFFPKPLRFLAVTPPESTEKEVEVNCGRRLKTWSRSRRCQLWRLLLLPFIPILALIVQTTLSLRSSVTNGREVSEVEEQKICKASRSLKTWSRSRRCQLWRLLLLPFIPILALIVQTTLSLRSSGTNGREVSEVEEQVHVSLDVEEKICKASDRLKTWSHSRRCQLWRLLLLPFIPILALIVQTTLSLRSSVTNGREVSEVEEQVSRATELGKLVTRLQQERSEVAFFIFTNGSTLSVQL
ncbi:hypothetical protein JYU34_005627 [Plutella xylostella]|uniref:Transmembrane protein n=1 Tax=Plutella xylostella TaxID=51655 RepID=A0ABQ7QTQ6_PLUXY|nr:hypothetical protein JYU34_005627 [Plutella xylostella]